MVTTGLTRKQLRIEIAKQRKRIAVRSERIGLEQELRNIKRGQKPIFRLGARVKKGFKETASKVGKGLANQAQLIAERQERQRLASRKVIRKTRRPKRSGFNQPAQDVGFFGGLDF